MQYSNQKPLDPLIVNVFPLADGQSSTYTLYEDAGDSRAYQHDADARTELRATQKGSVLTVEIDRGEGQLYRECLPAAPTKSDCRVIGRPMVTR